MVSTRWEQYGLVRSMDTLEDVSNKIVVYYRRRPYQLLDTAKTPSEFKQVLDLNNPESEEQRLTIAIIETGITHKIKSLLKKWHL